MQQRPLFTVSLNLCIFGVTHQKQPFGIKQILFNSVIGTTTMNHCWTENNGANDKFLPNKWYIAHCKNTKTPPPKARNISIQRGGSSKNASFWKCVIKLQECQKHFSKSLGTFTIQLRVLKTCSRENALSIGFKNPFQS